MKILIVNKFYYNRGGSEIYVLGLEKMLKESGHEVAFFSMNDPENFKNEWDQYWVSTFTFRKFRRPFGDKETKIKFNKILDHFNPDIIHLNNIHTQISPVIVEIAHCRGIKIVWTIHDYKLLCPVYTCLNGKDEICEKCFCHGKNHCFKNNCKGNLLASFLFQKEAEKWSRERLEKQVDAFICPSHFMKEKMIQGGFSENKLHTLHNFVRVPGDVETKKNTDHYYLYVGRLSKEKGLSTLCNVASQLPYKLKIVGTGPMETELRKQYQVNPQIEFLGIKTHTDVLQMMANAKFVIIPSEWYENNPLSVLEALCLGTPVLGTNIGGIPELIRQENGELFEPKNEADLKEKIKQMMHKNYELNQSYFAEKFSSKNYLKQLETIYKTI